MLPGEVCKKRVCREKEKGSYEIYAWRDGVNELVYDIVDRCINSHLSFYPWRRYFRVGCFASLQESRRL